MIRLERSDAYVSLALLTGLVLVLGAAYWLTSADRDYFALFVEYEQVEGLSEQTPVRLHGFPVGRIQEIKPTMTEAGSVVFRVELRIEQDFVGDSALFIPRGTTARVSHPPVVGSPFIVLEPPAEGGPALASGAEIPGVRSDAFLEQVQILTGQVSFSVTETLNRAVTLMDSVETTVQRVNSTVGVVERDLPEILAQIRHTVNEADSLTGDIRRMVDRTEPSLTATLDSASVVLGEAHTLVGRLDGMAAASEPRVDLILANLDSLTWVLNHFVTQISERPLRILTGVDPAPPRY